MIIYVAAYLLLLVHLGTSFRGPGAPARALSSRFPSDLKSRRSSQAAPSRHLRARETGESDDLNKEVSPWSPEDLEVLISEDASASPRLKADVNAKFYRVAAAVSASVGLACVLASILGVNSGAVSFAIESPDMTALFDPKQFNPVCPNSDGVYSLLKNSANFVVGPENVIQYGPLIASVLLRIRLFLLLLGL